MSTTVRSDESPPAARRWHGGFAHSRFLHSRQEVPVPELTSSPKLTGSEEAGAAQASRAKLLSRAEDALARIARGLEAKRRQDPER